MRNAFIFNNSALDSKFVVFNLSIIEYASVVIWAIGAEEEVRGVFLNDGRRLVFDSRPGSYRGFWETLSRIEDFVLCVKLFK